MEEQWGSEDDDGCSLEIGFTKPNEAGLVQMYASFDFISITGIMRFVNLNAQDDEDEDEVPPRPAHYLFPTACLPSTRSHVFSFRWRGEDTGTGEIQLYSDEDMCSIKFESPQALTGVFISSLTRKIEFKGFWEGSETKLNKDPDYEWHSRSETAYEGARKARWR
jgi:hypothetical protein